MTTAPSPQPPHNPGITFVPPPHEMQYYNNLFQRADTTRTGVVSGAEAVTFFTRSKLPTPTLKHVWNVAVAAGRHRNPIPYSLDKKQFFVAVRAIQLFQNGVAAVTAAPHDGSGVSSLAVGVPTEGVALRPPYFDGVSSSSPPPPPSVTAGYSSSSSSTEPPPLAPNATTTTTARGRDPYTIHPREKTRYARLFSEHCAKDGYVYKPEATALFSQSGLPWTQLREVWNVAAENPVDNRLDAVEFAVAMHLIACVGEKGLTMPAGGVVELPESLRIWRERERGAAVVVPPSSSGTVSSRGNDVFGMMTSRRRPRPPRTPHLVPVDGRTIPHPCATTKSYPLLPRPPARYPAAPQRPGTVSWNGTVTPGFVSPTTRTPPPPELDPTLTAAASNHHPSPAPSPPPPAPLPLSAAPAPSDATKSVVIPSSSSPSSSAMEPHAVGGMSITEAFSYIDTADEDSAVAARSLPSASTTAPGHCITDVAPKMTEVRPVTSVPPADDTPVLPLVMTMTKNETTTTEEEEGAQNRIAVVTDDTLPRSANTELKRLQRALRQLSAERVSLKAQLSSFSQEERKVKDRIAVAVAEVDVLRRKLVASRRDVGTTAQELVAGTRALERVLAGRGFIGDVVAEREQMERVVETNKALTGAVAQNLS